jgi:hypothetical protein
MFKKGLPPVSLKRNHRHILANDIFEGLVLMRGGMRRVLIGERR